MYGYAYCTSSWWVAATAVGSAARCVGAASGVAARSGLQNRKTAPVWLKRWPFLAARQRIHESYPARARSSHTAASTRRQERLGCECHAFHDRSEVRNAAALVVFSVFHPPRTLRTMNSDEGIVPAPSIPSAIKVAGMAPSLALSMAY
ncbi:hypothetical protein JB92DRAFT_2957519 [Gautieria morchelliformis]|nr:hypothetical protein JB92DRAFT_2957519 [Gautieria morchelliformis]